ncbi:MAG: N-acetylmuramoyl-L-alanine amidase [Chloroflexota bacterium]
MFIDQNHRLVKDEGEDFKITFDAANVTAPAVQDSKRTLVIHAPPSGSVGGAVQTIKDNLKINKNFSFSAHIVIGRNGRDITQMIPFNTGANHADKEYNKRSIAIYLEYPGELIKKENEARWREKYPGIEFALGTPLGSSRYGNWPLFPKVQLDTLLAIGKALRKKYQINDAVAYDEILSPVQPHPGPMFPIVQFRERLLGVNDRSMVLQEIASGAHLLTFPGNSGINLTSQPLPIETQVSVINERDDWYLVSVIGEVEGSLWRTGWVPKSSVRVDTDFIPKVRNDHYLVTTKGRRFQEIKPHKNGFEEKPLMLAKGERSQMDPVKTAQYTLKYIIMHFTTGTRMESSINHFKDPSSLVSTHLLIGRDGRVVQFLPFNKVAHHSGFSWWEGKSNLNTMSIGIEMDNAGLLIRRKNDQGKDTWFRRNIEFKENQIKRDVHMKQYIPLKPDGKPDKTKFPAWEKFTEVQLEVAFKIVEALVKKYKIEEILGHDDVNLRNRYDPGPAFPLTEWRQKLFKRREPKFTEYAINQKTNLYGNFAGRLPNTKQTTFDVPLPEGSLVKVLRREPDFTLVSVLKTKDPRAKATGWIQTASLDTENTKGAKGGKTKKKGAEGKAERVRTTISQVFFKRGDDVPTPRVGAGPFGFGTLIRVQEFREEWALVVLLDRTGKNKTGPAYVEGWMPKKFVSLKGKLPTFPRIGGAGAIAVSSAEPLWRHKNDFELGVNAPTRTFGELRAVPEVYTLEDRGMPLTKQWQFFIYAINFQMDIKKISAIFGTRRAFTNKKGFPSKPHDPPRADWILGENLGSPNPEFDKTRTCARSVMTGNVVGNKLRVKMLDGNLPPPLKEGRTYPESIKDVDPDDYLYLPWTHRYYFFAANTVDVRGETSPFPKGGNYKDLIGDNRMYTWLPHVSKFPVLYPLSMLEKVPAGEPIPSPYTD